MRLLIGICGLSAAALVASSAFADNPDRPDLMDVNLGSFFLGLTTNGAPDYLEQAVNDSGKGQPVSGASNRLGEAWIDTNYASVNNTLEGTVPLTTEGGTKVQLIWFNQEFDSSQRKGTSAKIQQKKFVLFRARVLGVTTNGAEFVPDTVNGAELSWEAPDSTDNGAAVAAPAALEDCSAKFQAKGVPGPVGYPFNDPERIAPVPTSAKWQASCKSVTYGQLLTAIGVPAANATTILQGLLVPATDKVKIKGGS